MKALSLLVGLLLLSGCQHVQTPPDGGRYVCEIWGADSLLWTGEGGCPFRIEEQVTGARYWRMVGPRDGEYGPFVELQDRYVSPVTGLERQDEIDKANHAAHPAIVEPCPSGSCFHIIGVDDDAPASVRATLTPEQEDRLVQRIVSGRAESTKQMATALPVGHIYVERTDTGLNCIDQYPHFAIAWESRADGICYEADAPALRQP